MNSAATFIGTDAKEEDSISNVLSRLEAVVLKRVFRANHLLLSHQMVSTAAFLIILLLSFLQILFNIFYKVEMVNDFLAASSQSTSRLLSSEDMMA